MGIKIIARNKRASFDYYLQEKVEAGIVLQGTEVKVLRLGKGRLEDAYVTIDGKGEAWIYNFNIPHYEFGNVYNHYESRKRKLLLHKKEIKRLDFESRAHGLTIIPTSIYFKDSKVKIEIALAKGKKAYDKRQSEAEKDAKRATRLPLED